MRADDALAKVIFFVESHNVEMHSILSSNYQCRRMQRQKSEQADEKLSSTSYSSVMFSYRAKSKHCIEVECREHRSVNNWEFEEDGGVYTKPGIILKVTVSLNVG